MCKGVKDKNFNIITETIENKGIYNYNKITKKYIKIISNINNENLEKKMVNKNNKNLIKKIKNIKNNNIKNNNIKNNNIINIDQLNYYISINIYKDLYDFFYSHFLFKKININSFLENLIIKFPENKNRKNKKEIEYELINFFRNFDNDELCLFNRVISGSTNKLQEKYIIKIYFNNNSVTSIFHTCFITLDLSYPYFEKNFLTNKLAFINLLNNIKNNFEIA